MEYPDTIENVKFQKFAVKDIMKLELLQQPDQSSPLSILPIWLNSKSVSKANLSWLIFLAFLISRSFSRTLGRKIILFLIFLNTTYQLTDNQTTTSTPSFANIGLGKSSWHSFSIVSRK